MGALDQEGGPGWVVGLAGAKDCGCSDHSAVSVAELLLNRIIFNVGPYVAKLLSSVWIR